MQGWGEGERVEGKGGGKKWREGWRGKGNGREGEGKEGVWMEGGNGREAVGRVRGKGNDRES